MRSRRRREYPLGIILRVTWGRRIETAVALVAAAVHQALPRVPDPHLLQLWVAVGVGALVLTPPSRMWLAGVLARERTERLFAQASVDVGLAPADITAMWPVPSGSRLSLSIPPGSICEDFDKASEALAVEK